MKKQKDPLADVVDEMGTLDAELAPWRPKIARLELLKKSVRQVYDSEPEGATGEIHGERFSAYIGPRAMERLVNVVKLFKCVGLKRFLALVKASLNTVEANCAPDVALACIETTQTGTRPLKVFVKV